MYKKNRIKEMIDNGQAPLGMQCFAGDPALIEIYESYKLQPRKETFHGF